MTRFLPREISPRIRQALEDMPVVVLTGLRQVGKSTLLEQDPAFRGRRYATFDDLSVLEAAKREPESFLEGGPLTLDEVQRCPEILHAIKRHVDRRRQPGTFLLSGSANLRLLKAVSESLAGRAIYLELMPFTHREKNRQTGKLSFLEGLLDGRVPAGTAPAYREHDAHLGGLPSVALGDVKHTETWFKGYVQTYLERDLRDLSRVGDLAEFRRLMQLLALRIGGILNVSELARDAKMNVMTVTRYLSLLETSYVIRRLPPYLGNKASRLVKAPKMYFSDSGLGSYLAGWHHMKGDHPMMGAFLENWAVLNLIAVAEAVLPDAVFSYWNIQGRHEVDLILESGGRVVAFEFKRGSRFREGDLRGLKAFLETSPPGTMGILATAGGETIRLGKNLWTVPVPRILS